MFTGTYTALVTPFKGGNIDEVALASGPLNFNNPEGFENGFGDWYADGGIWETGKPLLGPPSAKSGNNSMTGR